MIRVPETEAVTAEAGVEAETEMRLRADREAGTAASRGSAEDQVRQTTKNK